MTDIRNSPSSGRSLRLERIVQGNRPSHVDEQDQDAPKLHRFNVLDVRSITLENKGSVARDHLANERTFLAWLRTSLSFVTLGIGITQLFKLEDKTSRIRTPNNWVDIGFHSSQSDDLRKYGKGLGAMFILLGIGTLLFGVTRFIQVQTMLTKSLYPATRFSIVVIVLVVLAAVAVSFVLIVKLNT